MPYLVFEETGINQIPSPDTRKMLAENYYRIFVGGSGTSGLQYRSFTFGTGSNPLNAVIDQTLPLDTAEAQNVADVIFDEVGMNFIAYNFDPSSGGTLVNQFNTLMAGVQNVTPIVSYGLFFIEKSLIDDLI